MATIATYNILDTRDYNSIDNKIKSLSRTVDSKEYVLQTNINDLFDKHDALKAYAENNNALIDQLDIDKIDYADIVDDVSSEWSTDESLSTVPLSAKAGSVVYNTALEGISQAQTEYTRATNAERELDNRLDVVEHDINTFLNSADLTADAIDTLREIQDYIDSDLESAAQIIASISSEESRAKKAESNLDAAKINYADIVDTVSTDYINDSAYSSVPLSARAGSIAYNTAVSLFGDEKNRAIAAEETLSQDISNEETRATNAESNLNTKKIDYDDIVNDLTTGGEKVPLSAEQGKVLNTTLSTAVSQRIPKDAIVDNLIDGGSTKVLSAQQGVVLNEKIDTTMNNHNTNIHTPLNTRIDGIDTRIDGVDTRIDGIDTRIDSVTEALETRVSKASIANDLTTDDENKVLSASQGVVLKGLYDNIPSWALAANKPTYTYTEVGADAEGAATDAVSAHNTSADAHSDIRQAITNVTSALQDRIHKSSIIDDIVNDTSDRTGKVLSAGQGDMLYGLIKDLITRVETLEGGSTTAE